MKTRLLLVVMGLIGSAGYGAPGMVAERCAHHLLLRAGESRDLGGLGEHLEAIHLTDPPAVELAGGTLNAVTGGISCLRYRYRDGGDFNGVQTVCAVVFDEKGTCKGRDPLLLDLEMFLQDSKPGDANYMAHGKQIFYGSCKIEGRYRLRRRRARIQEWIDAGFELWRMGFLQFTAQGVYRSLREQAPDFHLFDGVVLGAAQPRRRNALRQSAAEHLPRSLAFRARSSNRLRNAGQGGGLGPGRPAGGQRPALGSTW